MLIFLRVVLWPMSNYNDFDSRTKELIEKYSAIQREKFELKSGVKSDFI